MTGKYNDIIQELLNDPEVRTELAKATTLDEAADIVVRLVKKQGHDITPEALRQAFFPPDGELSDAELETVVGGKGSPDKEIVGDGSIWAQFAICFGATSGDIFNDEINAGDGNDTLWGGYGNDTIYGGDGNDSMDGGYGAGEKNDGDDYLDGGSGNDTMWGGIGDDEMHGGEDNDFVHGNEDNDTLYGDGGNDSLYGDEGDDVLDGGDGHDQLQGGQGSDILNGGAGNDTLFGDSGNDTLTGGEGHDIFVFNNNGGTDTITDFDPGADKLRFESADSIGDISVVSGEGRTYIEYGDSTIILEGVELTAQQVWSRRG